MLLNNPRANRVRYLKKADNDETTRFGIIQISPLDVVKIVFDIIIADLFKLFIMQFKVY